MQDYGLVQHVLTPTRGANVLDLLLTNYNDLISDIKIREGLGFSDHASIYCLLNLLPPKQSHTTRMLYNYSKANFTEFRDCLQKIPWDVASSEDIDNWWLKWKDLFFTAVDCHVPCVRWR